jgi:uncharacterized protein
MSETPKPKADAPKPAAMRFDLPTPEADTQPFWDAAREKKLLIKRCGGCGKNHFYPRPFCPHCWSADVGWREASGRGTLYTYSIVHQNDLPPFNQRVPYVAAIVDLAEGPRVMTNLVDVEHDAIRVGMGVEATFQAISDDVTIPVFRPAK